MGDSSLIGNSLTDLDSTILLKSSIENDNEHDDENDKEHDNNHHDTNNDPNEELQQVMKNAKSLIRKLNSHIIKSPVEEFGCSSVELRSIDGNDNEARYAGNSIYDGANTIASISPYLNTPDTKTVYDGTTHTDDMVEKDVASVLGSLVNVLNNSLRQVQQLKFKNMILKSNSDDIQSTYEVEQNLRKQQYERTKCQLLFENQHLLEKLRVKEDKVIKYKSRIVSKNREINRLMRILNEHSISDTSQVKTSTIAIRRPSPTINKPASSTSKDKTSDMLKTLGMLASQVLNHEIDDDSESHSASQPLSKYIDCNTTEPEVLQSPSLSMHTQTTNQMQSMRNKSHSVTSTDSSNSVLNYLPIKLPKMKSFSTVDGTVKDIE